MAIEYSASLTLEYEDSNTRTYAFTGMTAASLSGLKARVIGLNDVLADDTQNTAYRETFISDDGAPVKRISKAKYTATEESVIYRG